MQQNIEEDLDYAAEELVGLEKFARTSKLLFTKVLHKYDKYTNSRASALWLVRLEMEDFWQVRLDHLIVGMSRARENPEKKN